MSSPARSAATALTAMQTSDSPSPSPVQKKGVKWGGCTNKGCGNQSWTLSDMGWCWRCDPNHHTNRAKKAKKAKKVKKVAVEGDTEWTPRSSTRRNKLAELEAKIQELQKECNDSRAMYLAAQAVNQEQLDELRVLRDHSERWIRWRDALLQEKEYALSALQDVKNQLENTRSAFQAAQEQKQMDLFTLNATKEQADRLNRELRGAFVQIGDLQGQVRRLQAQVAGKERPVKNKPVRQRLGHKGRGGGRIRTGGKHRYRKKKDGPY